MREFKNSERSIPENSLRLTDHTGKITDREISDIQCHPSVIDSIRRNHLSLCPIAELTRHDGVLWEKYRNSKLFCFLEDISCEIEGILFTERIPDISSLCPYESIRHPSTDDEMIHDRQKSFDDSDFCRYLSTSEDRSDRVDSICQDFLDR